MILVDYVQEIPYKNLNGTSYCDSCGLSFDRRLMFRFSIRNQGIKVCPKCKQNLFKLVAPKDYYIILQDNIELIQQTVELMDTIQYLHKRNEELQSMNEHYIDMIAEKSR